MRKILFAILALVAVGAAIWWLATPAVRDATPLQTSPAEGARRAGCGECAGKDDVDADEEPADEPDADDEEERLVEAFDALTDRWEEETGKTVSMDDIAAFAKAFKALPEDRRDECIQRALNLLPDENVMLLVGVLMDRSVDEDIVVDVFNDILNRDDDVKEPILREILKDRSHPCWEDADWILDAEDGE